mmetsp:Transcript_38808/g.51137  ORF Transcript_38808/g.51137 Transcript_38808/m.51137 type:complete len:139 (+) Transcript_38808:150-566(+)
MLSVPSIQTFIVYGFPIPLTLLVALTFQVHPPLDRMIQKILVKLIDLIYVRLIVILWTIGLAILSLQTWQSSNMKRYSSEQGYEQRYLVDKARKFRVDRDFWLVAFGWVLWVMLYSMHNMIKRAIHLQNEIDDLKKQR